MAGITTTGVGALIPAYYDRLLLDNLYQLGTFTR
jgi:hypothetical protein